VGHGGASGRDSRAGTVQRGTQDGEQARGMSKHTSKHKGTNNHTKQNTKSVASVQCAIDGGSIQCAIEGGYQVFIEVQTCLKSLSA
jgi:hypothetical protein